MQTPKGAQEVVARAAAQTSNDAEQFAKNEYLSLIFHKL